nr:hypothetical protein [Crocosphaera sp.]
ILNLLPTAFPLLPQTKLGLSLKVQDVSLRLCGQKYPVVSREAPTIICDLVGEDVTHHQQPSAKLALLNRS